MFGEKNEKDNINNYSFWFSNKFLSSCRKSPRQCKLYRHTEYYQSRWNRSKLQRGYTGFTFRAKSPLDKEIYYFISWGDRNFSGWSGPYSSEHQIYLEHRWWDEMTYTIRFRAKDVDGRWGPWGEHVISVTNSRATYSNTLLLRLLEQFQNALPILRYIFNNFLQDI